MRLLIGNHIDTLFVPQFDQRAFAQRVLWFARPNDIVVLPGPVDLSFALHVAKLTKVEPSSWRAVTAPLGVFGHRLFDPAVLVRDEFVALIGTLLESEIAEIFALWPSPYVAHLATKLGISPAFPGSDFFLQGGAELANSKAHFRAIAAAAGVPIAKGAVCRSKEHALYVIRTLLSTSDGVVVKQCHNATGCGNEVLVLHDRVNVDNTGCVGQRILAPEEIADYLDGRWHWASVGGAFPVVVEEFIVNARTIYAEFYASESTLTHTAIGELIYKNGRLVEETVPLHDLCPLSRQTLIAHGTRLGDIYRTLGYRGYMSTDAVMTQPGHFFFTEMNARPTASLHVYKVIAPAVAAGVRRVVTQVLTPPTWYIGNFDHFLETINRLGLAYNSLQGKGVMASMPYTGAPGSGGLLFCVIHDGREDLNRILEILTVAFTRPDDRVSESDGVC